MREGVTAYTRQAAWIAHWLLSGEIGELCTLDLKVIGHHQADLIVQPRLGPISSVHILFGPSSPRISPKVATWTVEMRQDWVTCRNI